ncbi:MAG TPA: 2Fe-2S iron-sulfur cluster binding domain-containing protein [Bacillales bacterium]|nr:2Fe-2S iron-sulfur cluster binding domain-containing protein [Bacillales bacterium]
MKTRVKWQERWVEVKREKSLLHGLLEIGVEPPFRCEFGHCGSCRMRLTAGSVVHDDVAGLTEADRKANIILLCSCRPLSTSIELEPME